MVKTILSGSFVFDDPIAQLVPVHSRGVDSGWQEKRAAARVFDMGELWEMAKKGEELVHVLALGDSEYYGCNRNGDGFSSHANEVYHPTFMKASFFHHHDNKPDSPKYGRVVAAAHNPNMHRVELVLGVDAEKAASDLTDLEKKGEFPVSMSCKVAYDTCSICGNKAKNRKEYCDHAKNHLTKICEDGRQVYVDNPHPHYFDISKVFRPADRIAWTFERLEKAASGAVIGGAQVAEELGIEVPDWVPGTIVSRDWSQKVSVLRKIAAVSSESVPAAARAFQVQELPTEAVASLRKESSLDSVLGALHDARVMLSVNDFLSLVGIEKPASVTNEDVQEGVRTILKRASSVMYDGTEICKNGSYDGGYGQVNSEASGCVSNLARTHGLDPTRMSDRLLRTVLRSGIPVMSVTKSAGSISPLATPIAREYVAYLVSFVKRAGTGQHAAFVQNLVGVQACQ
jgi:hypothetical protein